MGFACNALSRPKTCISISCLHCGCNDGMCSPSSLTPPVRGHTLRIHAHAVLSIIDTLRDLLVSMEGTDNFNVG